jgi:hypothetical protein
MRDEDADHEIGSDLFDEEHLDFEPITSGRSTSASSDTTSNADSSKEELTELPDRIVPTVAVPATDTDSRSISARVLSKQQNQAKRTIASAVESVIVDTRSISDIAHPETSTESGKDASKRNEQQPTEQELPDQIASIGTSTNHVSHTPQLKNPVQLHAQTVEQTNTVGTVRTKTLATDDRSTTEIMTLEQSNTGSQPVEEIDEFDPIYQWSGGNPYGTTTPQCIIHLDRPGEETLPFLKRVLRDTYTELEGGRPRTKSANVQAGRLTPTSVHGAIVTLDLTTPEWTVTMEDSGFAIRQSDRDMIPALQSVISTLYGGKLGYFILNIDVEDIQSRFLSNEKTELIRTLLSVENDSEIDLNSDTLSQQTASPIRIATPRNIEKDFEQVVKQYFSVDNIDQSRVPDIEAEYEDRLRANDWRRIALTQQHAEGDNESDEHYLSKAAIAAGLAWQMYEEYCVLEEDVSFEQFVQLHLIPSGPIHTESESDSDGEPTPDLRIDTNEVWAWNGTRELLPAPEPPKGSGVIVEFETGRAEGAFNFRKFYHTIDKYGEEFGGWIYLVVPPRTLFRSESRARMITNLITTWEKSGSDDRHAELCVPVLGQYGCNKLLSATSLINDWYGEEND